MDGQGDGQYVPYIHVGDPAPAPQSQPQGHDQGSTPGNQVELQANNSEWALRAKLNREKVIAQIHDTLCEAGITNVETSAQLEFNLFHRSNSMEEYIHKLGRILNEVKGLGRARALKTKVNQAMATNSTHGQDHSQASDIGTGAEYGQTNPNAVNMVQQSGAAYGNSKPLEEEPKATNINPRKRTLEQSQYPSQTRSGSVVHHYPSPASIQDARNPVSRNSHTLAQLTNAIQTQAWAQKFHGSLKPTKIQQVDVDVRRSQEEDHPTVTIDQEFSQSRPIYVRHNQSNYQMVLVQPKSNMIQVVHARPGVYAGPQLQRPSPERNVVNYPEPCLIRHGPGQFPMQSETGEYSAAGQQLQFTQQMFDPQYNHNKPVQNQAAQLEQPDQSNKVPAADAFSVPALEHKSQTFAPHKQTSVLRTCTSGDGTLGPVSSQPWNSSTPGPNQKLAPHHVELLQRINKLRSQLPLLQKLFTKLGTSDTALSRGLQDYIHALTRNAPDLNELNNVHLCTLVEEGLDRLSEEEGSRRETIPLVEPIVKDKERNADEEKPEVTLGDIGISITNVYVNARKLSKVPEGKDVWKQSFGDKFGKFVGGMKQVKHILPDLPEDSSLDSDYKAPDPKLALRKILEKEFRVIDRRRFKVEGDLNLAEPRLRIWLINPNTSCVPALRVIIPHDYPAQPPSLVGFDKDYNSSGTGYLSSIAQMLKYHRLRSANNTLSALLIAWEMCVIKAK